MEKSPEMLKFQELQEKAQQGDPAAQYELGECYALGKGVPQDDKEAAKWYRLAVVQGHAGALQAILDIAEFQKLQEKAQQGDPKAQCELGNCYMHGKGVPHDQQEAVKWFRLAVEKGHAGAQQAISHIAEFQKLQEKAQQGDPAAQYMLGNSFEYGRCSPQDWEEAVKWWRLAAEQWYADAQYKLAECYADGNGVPQDWEEAVKWYRLAAEQGHAKAQKALDALNNN
ncbi:MAG: tetratricopeptide repeat protein [Oligosphaeraceae bacterium]